jgi:hypothetical protein
MKRKFFPPKLQSLHFALAMNGQFLLQFYFVISFEGKKETLWRGDIAGEEAIVWFVNR